jgi:hypothetical protein
MCCEGAVDQVPFSIRADNVTPSNIAVAVTANVQCGDALEDVHKCRSKFLNTLGSALDSDWNETKLVSGWFLHSIHVRNITG